MSLKESEPQDEDARLLGHAVDVCRRAAPHDLAGLAVYLVPQAGLKRHQRSTGPCGALGWTSHHLDVELRPQLERAGVWQGRGFAAVIDLERVRARAGCVDDLRVSLFSVVIHELAHFLCWPSPSPGYDYPAFRRVLADSLRMARQPSPPTPATPSVPWIDHGMRFTRCGLHLVQRLTKAKVFLSDRQTLFGSEQYGLSGGEAYRHALGYEFWEQRRGSIRAVLDQPLPTAFAELFQRDVERWYVKEVTMKGAEDDDHRSFQRGTGAA